MGLKLKSGFLIKAGRLFMCDRVLLLFFISRSEIELAV